MKARAANGLMRYRTVVKPLKSSFSRGQGTSVVTPEERMSLPEIVAYLKQRPNDRFMDDYLAQTVGKMGEPGVRQAVELFKSDPSLALFGVLARTNCERFPIALEALETLDKQRVAEMFANHPRSDVRALQKGEFFVMEGKWVAAFDRNRDHHVPLGETGNLQLPICSDMLPALLMEIRSVDEFDHSPASEFSKLTGTGLRAVLPHETLGRVMPLLTKIGGGKTELMQFPSNGTANALLLGKKHLIVNSGRHHYSVSGGMHASGKGLTEATALVSAVMEYIERYSAGGGVGENWPGGYAAGLSLKRAPFSELDQALDPAEMNLGYAYEDQPLYWVRGEMRSKKREGETLVPAQIVFEGLNLDEHVVFAGSSTGLASGNTMLEAKLHALLEVIERDGDFNMFYHPDRTFVLEAEDARIKKILDAYRQKGLTVQILDLTTEFGVPTYRAFVQIHGQMLSGSGAHLSGHIAAFRAICELNTKAFVFEMKNKGFKPEEQQQAGKETRKFEELPTYSTANLESDLSLLETMLIANGLEVFYVDLTREELGISVVRAIVPGLDVPSIISGRQVRHFMQQYQPEFLASLRQENH